MILVDSYKLRNEIEKSDGYADSEYGKGICAGISRALRKLDEAEPFDLDKHDLEIRADERNKTIEEMARRLNLKIVELPLDDLIVADILKDIKRIAEQMKGNKE